MKTEVIKVENYVDKPQGIHMAMGQGRSEHTRGQPQPRRVGPWTIGTLLNL